MSRPDDHQQLHAIVHGRVQGVSFRYYTLQVADDQGLVGWVRNLPDGSVEVIAEGPRPDLDDLVGFLHRGPPGARVTAVDLDWRPANGQFTEFRVTH